MAHVYQQSFYELLVWMHGSGPMVNQCKPTLVYPPITGLHFMADSKFKPVMCGYLFYNNQWFQLFKKSESNRLRFYFLKTKETPILGIWKDIKIKDPLILVFPKPQRTTMSKDRTNNFIFF
jgi:hypothetical protein